MIEGETILGLTQEQLKVALATGAVMALFGFVTGIASVIITTYVKEKVT